MTTIWFTSDQHYDHANIIKLCGRPFKDMNEMRETMISNFNALVAKDDKVWHLGDFCLTDRNVKPILCRLNGQHRLVAGNHDECHSCHKKGASRVQRYLDAGFLSVTERETLHVPGVGRVNVCHMPYRGGGDHTVKERYAEHRPEDDGRWLLHGHVHDAWKVKRHMLNVGVDVWAFSPITMDTVAETILATEALEAEPLTGK